MEKIGLVIEGGGFRGLFAEGITDWFLDQGIDFPYVIGVSMGASTGISYVSKQKSRNYDIARTFMKDPRYISMKNLVTQKSLFGMDFIFNDIGNVYKPFDYQAFNQSSQEFVIGATDCMTGKPTYISKSNHPINTLIEALKASISLPFISKEVFIDETPYLDGGITDPIPIEKALLDGCDKLVVISTRHRSYSKSPIKGQALLKLFYNQYPGIVEALENRHKVYNKTKDKIDHLIKEKKLYLICPETPLTIGRLERDLDKIAGVHQAGYETAQKHQKNLGLFLEKDL